MNPSIEEFRELAKKFNRITVYKETDGDMDTPVSILLKLLSLNRAILLESAKESKVYSRFSFLAFDIKEALVLKQDGLYKNGVLVGDISYLKEILRQNRAPLQKGFGDFSGGYVGCLNFEYVEQCGILRQPLVHKDATAGTLYLVEKFCVCDNYTNRLYLALSKKIDDSISIEETYQKIKEELEASGKQLKSLASVSGLPREPVVVPEDPQKEFYGQGAENQKDDRGRRGHTGRFHRFPGDRQYRSLRVLPEPQKNQSLALYVLHQGRKLLRGRLKP